MFDFQNKVVLIIGAAQGFGRVLAAVFLALSLLSLGSYMIVSKCKTGAAKTP